MPVKTLPVGSVFGKLKVTSDAGVRCSPKGAKRGQSLCICDCGKETVVLNRNLRNGQTKSCGCLRIERSTKHGHAREKNRSRTWRSWRDMLARCRNSNGTAWKYYGGDGVTVCDRWSSFVNFLADMGECPPGLTIDRKINSLGYSHSNCKWSTRKEQSNNRRNNIVVDAFGVRATLAEHRDRLGKDATWYAMVKTRIKRGWSRERAITQAARKLNRPRSAAYPQL